MAPKHVSTPALATTRQSDVVSPVSVDPDSADEDLPAGDEEKDTKPNDDDEACRDRHHRFEQLTKTILAAPAKKFYKAYDNFMMQFSREEFGDTISKEYGDKLLQAVDDAFDVVEEAREKCLEVLTADDLVANPKYEQYMKDMLARRCTCERMYQKYFEDQQKFEQYRQQPQEVHQVDSNKPLYQPPPMIAMPQPPYIPIISRPPPVMTPQLGQTLHFGGVPMMPPPPTGHQPTRAFQIYNDQSPIPPHTGPSVAQEQSFYQPIKFKLKEELSVIDHFDGTKPQEYLRFRVQWRNLHDKMEKTHLSELDKFNALRKVIGGDARDLIDTKYPGYESYKRSIDKLDRTYYDPSLHLRGVIKSLAETNLMKDTHDSLLQGFNRLKDIRDDLEHADLSKEQLKGLFFISANEKNLSEGTWQEWQKMLNNPKNPENPMECFNSDALLTAINTARKNAQRRQGIIGKHSSIEQKPKLRSTLYGAYNTTTGPIQQENQQAGNSCVFCSRPHHKYQLYCRVLKTLQPDEIWRIVKKNGITCYMCLCIDHDTKSCEATNNGKLKRCNIKDDEGNVCGKFHCRFLHKVNQKEPTQPEHSEASGSTNQA